jgi:hypothetical protein
VAEERWRGGINRFFTPHTYVVRNALVQHGVRFPHGWYNLFTETEFINP